MRDGLYRVTTSYLCAGFVVEAGRVTACAPILRRKLDYWKTIAVRVSEPGEETRAMRAYAGIGSRETPADVRELMTCIARQLGARGWTLRSGAADGADRAFEEGAWDAAMVPYGVRGPKPEIYLPWASFNDGSRVMLGKRYYVTEPQPEAFEIAARFHPAWDRLGRGPRALHARNAHQILGPDVTKPVVSRFVICWTKGGAGGGGTGQALRMAKHYGVEVFDLALPSARQRLEAFAFA